jgi:outer membrane protein assembly complex protein YaeT
MNVTDNDTAPARGAEPGGEHPTARQRQRRGAMFGCMRALTIVGGGIVLLILLVAGGLYWWVGSNNFAELVRTRVVSTLESRLGRKVTIGSVVIVRHNPQQIIINDLRIANAEGAGRPYFATVKQLVITGGIDSFWLRKIKVGRVDVVGPALFFEVFPAGSKLQHNFPHWTNAPKSRYEIYHLDLGKMFVRDGAFEFLDRRHDMTINSAGLTSEINVTSAEDVYEGVAASPNLHVRIQDFVPFDVAMRGGFRYTPNVLQLKSIALSGPDLLLYLSGRIDPLADGVYNLRLTSKVGLNRVKEIFKVNKTLEGNLAIDGTLRGRQGTFTLAGGWIAPRLRADVYELTNLKGKLSVTDTHAVVDVDTARYGGGTIGAHYVLPGFNEPYPMSVDLRYNGVSLEKLFADWGIEGTGLRGGATGKLAYHWNKDLVLQGAGDGTATLSKNATAFSSATYPIPLAGSADFALDNGVINFRRGELTTDASRINFRGTLRIEDVFTDLALQIHSGDFAELDRAAFNFAKSAGKKDYTLLGLGGAGDITGTVRGKLKTPQVAAHIAATGTKYNNVLLGDSDIDLKYDGARSELTFQKATFRDANGQLALTGTVAFPDRGPSPRFDLAVDAANYPVDRAMATVNLKLAVKGLGTGRLIVTGTGDAGKVTFVNLLVKQFGGAELRLNGDINWLPGKGNIRFALDVGARAFPVADIASFLDLGTALPVTGDVTGTLHLEGPKSALEGAGAITVRNGSIYGEPIESVTADIVFTKGSVKATNVTLTAPAGTLTGEAQLDLNTNAFSYNIASSNIDLSKLKALTSIAGLLGGKVTFTSTGAGTFEHPEVVIEATLNEATLKGLTLPAGSAPPTIYIALRGGRLIVRGGIADLVTIEGDAAVGTDYSVDGNVRVTVPDIAKLAAISPSTATVPASGNFIVDLKLGGKLTSIADLQVYGTFPAFNLKVSDHAFSAVEPLRVSLRNGRLLFEQFRLHGEGAEFGVTGGAELAGDKRLDININGRLEAALLQLFVKDLRADGHIIVDAGIRGTLAAPLITGTADLQAAQFKFAGFPQMIDHVEGRLVFKGDRIEIEGIRATMGGGTLAAGGYIGIEGLSPKRARITLQGTGVAIRYFEGLTVEGDFNLVVNGDLDRAVVTGDVDVTRALYFKDFDFRTSLLNVILSRRGVTPVVAASWQDHVDLRVHLVAPNTIAVRNNIADVTGTAEVDLTGTLANPVVLGLVTLNEGGTLRFQNIDYSVVRGSINFQNPFRIDPYFDVTVEGRISGGFSEIESDAGPVTVTVNLTGTIDRFTPTVTSDPPASDITLFTLLGVGSLVNSNRTGGSQAGGDASTAGKSLLYQNLFSAIGQKILPFADTFTYDPGLLDTTGDPGPKVTFEKRVSTRVRVLVIYNLRDQRSRELIEWQINPDWTLQFARDDINKEFRGEARFRRRYEGHWSFGDRGRNDFASSGSVSAALAKKPVPPSATPPAGIPATLPSTIVPADGRLVTQLNFRADAAFDTTLLTQYVALRIGEPVTIRALQTSLKSLYSTGNFRDIRVESVAEGNGVAVTFALFLNYRIADIRFDGLHGNDRLRAARELTVHLGDVLSLNGVDRSAVAVQDYLRRSGYVEATVDPETTFIRERSAADVTFHVTTGPLAKIARVEFEGDTKPFTAQQLIDAMRRKPGQPFQVGDARSDADRIRISLVRQNYRKAEVRYLGETYDAATKSVVLRYHVNVGPTVKVEVQGVPARSVRGAIPFRRNQPYSEDVVDTSADAIVRLYQQRGYYNAAVDTEEKLANGVWVITFIVSPGQQFHLTGVTFTGNQKLDDKTLRGIVATAPNGGIRALLATVLRRPTGVSRGQISADRDALESYYRLNGFSEAVVETPVVTTKADGSMTVDFPIVEGPQTLITDVHVEGVTQVAAKDLPALQLTTGKPLDPTLERADIVALQTFYSDRGNAEVQVAPRVEVSPDKTAAHVTYTVAEGPRVKIGDVVVRGNTYTKSNVVLRTAGISPGDPFSYTSILEAQRNLYRLGIFSRVDIQPEQAGTSLADRNVSIQVEEGKDLTIAGSVGMTKRSGEKFTPLGSASIAHRNLFGTGRYLGLELVGGGDRKEVFLTFREPFIASYDLPLQLTIFQNDERRRGAHIRERGGFIEATKVYRAQTRWSARYEYRIGDCIVEKTVGDICSLADMALLPGYDRSITNIKISSLTPTFFWDRRDDAIDPHRGFLTSASIEYAFPFAQATANFTKEFVQAAYYFPVSQRSVFAVSARLGLIQPQRGAGESAVPLSERFTAGGEASHRAFPLDLLGSLCLEEGETLDNCKPTLIRATDPSTGKVGAILPIGGRGLMIVNAEYRFPIFSSLGGAAFVDAGEVNADSTINFGKLRYGAGAGLRYLSPVGPLRFDVGFPLQRRVTARDPITNRPTAFERSYVYFITLGYAF